MSRSSTPWIGIFGFGTLNFRQFSKSNYSYKNVNRYKIAKIQKQLKGSFNFQRNILGSFKGVVLSFSSRDCYSSVCFFAIRDARPM